MSNPTAEAIVRGAIAQANAAHLTSLADMQRHTEEVHAQLRALTNQHVRGTPLLESSAVYEAARLDTTFWPEVVKRAREVIAANKSERIPVDGLEMQNS